MYLPCPIYPRANSIYIRETGNCAHNTPPSPTPLPPTHYHQGGRVGDKSRVDKRAATSLHTYIPIYPYTSPFLGPNETKKRAMATTAAAAAAAATATATAQDFIRLAGTLPAQLLRFFARFPPGTHTDVRSNPFKPTVFPPTGKWHNPVYSLRRQADLFKLARAHGVEELLPPSTKSSAFKAQRLLDREAKGGAAMARSINPKGRYWERTLHSKWVFFSFFFPLFFVFLLLPFPPSLSLPSDLYKEIKINIKIKRTSLTTDKSNQTKLTKPTYIQQTRGAQKGHGGHARSHREMETLRPRARLEAVAPVKRQKKRLVYLCLCLCLSIRGVG